MNYIISKKDGEEKLFFLLFPSYDDVDKRPIHCVCNYDINNILKLYYNNEHMKFVFESIEDLKNHFHPKYHLSFDKDFAPYLSLLSVQEIKQRLLIKEIIE